MSRIRWRRSGGFASRVVVLDAGRVVAVGGVEEVLGAGLSAAGISRFARSSVIAGTLTGVDEAYGLTEIAHPAGTIWRWPGRPDRWRGACVIKSTDIALAKARVEGMTSAHTLSGKVAGIDSDDGPIAGVSIALDGHGRLYALATRKAIDELGLARGDRVFALVKTVALDERAVAPTEL